MPIIDLRAIAFVCHCNHLSKDAQSNKDHVVNAMIEVASTLETDDVGYVYDPAEKEPEVCIIAGQMVGKVAKLNLPYGMSLSKAVDTAIDVMLSLDDDYNKLLHVITDSYKQEDGLYLNHSFRKAEKLCEIRVYGVGKKYHRPSLEELCANLGLSFTHVDDASQTSFQISQSPQAQPEVAEAEPQVSEAEAQKGEAEQEETMKSGVAFDSETA